MKGEAMKKCGKTYTEEDLKTPQEIFKEVITELGFHNYKPSEMTNSDYWLCTCKAMERYAEYIMENTPH